MNTSFATLDYVIFAVYAVVILGVGLWVSRSKEGETKNAEDYFLASKSLPWWAIGASLIAANISAEQFIGMSGSGFAGGLAIATYEWMAALTLIVVGKFFLPIFIKNKIGAYNWGFVSGKTNTIYPWKSWDSTYNGPPNKWHHDIFNQNGEPFSVDEINLFDKCDKKKS